MAPWGTTGSTVPYRIGRSPVKGGATPLQLPAASVVDLDFSSSGVNVPPGSVDLTVMFSGTGAVDSVYYGATRAIVTDPIYLLIGKRERVGLYTTPPPPAKPEAQFSNAEDINNLWVTINVQTGLVNTEPVALDIGAGAIRLVRLDHRELADRNQRRHAQHAERENGHRDQNFQEAQTATAGMMNDE